MLNKDRCMMTKRSKLILLMYAAVLFVVNYIFYTQVRPIMICDPDDWTYISSIRSPFPIWKNWNPSKVFPENLMGVCGFFAAYFIYPIFKDYILSFTYVYAFVVSISITFYIITLLLLMKKISDLTIFESLICSFIAYLLHFLFMMSQSTNNMFMFTASNLNCFINYMIPSLFCFVIAVFFISGYVSDNKNFLIGTDNNFSNYFKQGVILFFIYVAIFSNMVCNIILIAPFIYIFCVTLHKQTKTNGIRNLFKFATIKTYGLFIYTFLLELLCLIFEYNGGRAESLIFNGGGTVLLATAEDVKYILTHINKKVAVTCIAIICLAVFIYIRKRSKESTDIMYIKTLQVMLFSFLLTSLYMLLLYTRIGGHKLQRSENVFVIYIFFGCAVIISFGYICSLYKRIWVLMPLSLYIMVMLTLFGNYKPSISYYQGNTELCYMVNNNIIEQYKQAEYMGLDEFDLHVPESGLGSYTFTAGRISNTLYRHGITSKKLEANMVLEPIEYFYP